MFWRLFFGRDGERRLGVHRNKYHGCCPFSPHSAPIVRPPLRVKEESRTTLGRLREEKKAWFEARRKNRDGPRGTLVENDRDKALAVVERIVTSAAVAPSPGPPPPPTGPPGCPLANGVAASPSVSRRIAHAESPAEGYSGSRGKGTVDELRGAVTGLSMSGPEALEVKQDEEEDEL